MAAVTLGGSDPLSNLPQTLGELRRSQQFSEARVRNRRVKDEMRDNLMARVRSGGPVFPGIVGYDDTVVPQIVNAVLSRHNFILLGLRGQAKSRILRALTCLLDPHLPYLRGCEIHDNPFTPICRRCRELLADNPDAASIAYLTPEERYVEKLATPDVTIADLIGDIDPIKAAKGGHELGSEYTVHYGLLPRANRGIFAINELPDLAGKIQVGLFNIMQEGDVQIKGYPVRLGLDVALVFTANPEDYTARGKIITPLKDRIGSEIRTHYPATLEEGIAITAQEAWTERNGHQLQVPNFVSQVIEQIAFVAREDKRIDKRSGVSQRLPISAMENVISNAERRAIRWGEKLVVPRIGDIYAAMPAMTGKLELEYEGELKGADTVVREIIRSAVARTYDKYFHGNSTHEPGGAVVRSRRRDPDARLGQRARDAAQAAQHPGPARQVEYAGTERQRAVRDAGVGSGVHPGRPVRAQTHRAQRGAHVQRRGETTAAREAAHARRRRGRARLPTAEKAVQLARQQQN